MNITTFINQLEQELEGFPKDSITPDSDLRSFPEWSSMHALIIIALVDTEYNITITGEDLRSAKTVTDLFNIIKEKAKN